ncbi:MAG: DNA-3-methyladenine glycosylase [Chloroflexota bacterium]|nr:DNA-3-methyladenine glycosylase [Chloroflexota bacterium]
MQQVARELLGQRLVRLVDGQRVAGLILEAEAYDGESDLACHARSGKTERNAMMYGEAGHAYVYFTYGMHWMLNCVCGPAGYPAAVLLRAILPLEGLERIAARRAGIAEKLWCDGPAKLTKALSIDKNQNGADLCAQKDGLFIEKAPQIPEYLVQRTPRIGIDYAGEPWVSQPWRFIASAQAVRAELGI